METLVNDFRFTLYNVCYKRVLLVWVVFAFCVLLGLLFSGLKGIPLFSLGVGWLFLNAAAIFICMWVKLRLARGLERCLASVNKQLIRHKIIVALDDRGRISCHKVNLCFMYYDPEQCVSYLNDFIERSEQQGNTIEAGWESRLDVDVNDIIIQGSSTTRVSKRKVSVFSIRCMISMSSIFRRILCALSQSHTFEIQLSRHFIPIFSSLINRFGHFFVLFQILFTSCIHKIEKYS